MSLTAAEAAEWTKAFAPWVALAFVFLGWRVSNGQANSRETRKEIRQQVDRAIKLIESAADLGMKVHSTPLPALSSDESDPKSQQPLIDAQSKMRQMKFSLSQLSPQIQLLKERGIGSTDITDALIELRMNLMGGDFETTEQKPWPSDDPRWTVLSGSCVKLVTCLERAYQQRFNPNKNT